MTRTPVLASDSADGPSDDDDGYETIFRAWTTTPDGRRIYAKWFGRRAFPMRVRKRG